MWIRRIAPLAALVALSSPAAGICLSPPGDLDGSGATTVTDVQCSILANLWSLQGQLGPHPACIAPVGSPSVRSDHTCDLVINVADSVAAITFALGINPSTAVDANANGCFDACESDLDADGEIDLSDCAPHDPNVHPQAADTCGFDLNCDGQWDTNPMACPAQDVCETNGVCDITEFSAPMVISELLIAPTAAAAGAGDWIELTNTTSTPINIRGWLIAAGPATYEIDPGGAIFVPPAGAVVLAATRDRTQNGGVFVHAELDGFSLPDAGAIVALYDASGSLIDAVSTAPPFPNAPGRSTARTELASSGLINTAWALSSAAYGDGDQGTPGGPNVDVAPLPCGAGELLDGVPCDDGDPDTADDTCQDGLCVGSSGPCAGNGFCPETSTTVCGSYTVDSLYIPAGVVVSCAPGCTQPVQFVVSGSALIDGTLTVSGVTGSNGTATNSNPGGAVGGAGGVGACGGYGGGKGGNSQSGSGQKGAGPGGGGGGTSLLSVKPWGTFYNGGNAGGGGYATSGTSGFTSSGTGIAGSAGGTFGSATLATLQGGSGGGGGSGGLGGASTGYGGGGGGAGGGALRIQASGGIEIGASGVIEANGAAGATCQDIGARGAGGAGAGGAIYLAAPTVANQGTIRALGGVNCFLNGGSANDGRGGNGRIRVDTATGGAPTGTYQPSPGYLGTW